MRLILTSFVFYAVLTLASFRAQAFSLIGTNAAWQTPNLSYMIGGDIGAPQHLYEGFRWIYPVVFFRFDESFRRDFGERGMGEVRKAFTLMNNLGRVSSWSFGLSEFPKDARAINYSAANQRLFDMKTLTVSMLLEALGVAEAPRYVWNIRTATPAPSDPVFNYTIIMMNYDPINLTKTPYVNGISYGYHTTYAPGPVHNAVEDPKTQGAVWSYYPIGEISHWAPGLYCEKISYDDAGALRHLYNPNIWQFCQITNAGVAPTMILPGTWDNTSGYTIPNWGTNVYTDPWGLGTNSTLVAGGWRRGVDKVTFVEYDERYLTNYYSWTDEVWRDNPVVNGDQYTNPRILQTITRAVPRALADFTIVSSDTAGINLLYERNTGDRFHANSAANGEGFAVGPGQINPRIVFSYVKNHPVYGNQNPFYLYDYNASIGARWGTFDGSTNAPHIYFLQP